MKKASEIREEFLRFFEEKHQCTRVPSSSLVPDNPTLLLTSAGMVQFVPYFLGLEKPPYNPPRATSCQKCARAGGKDSDIENVGRTPRHHTFFEMLGNFSFGDYFKAEIIPWAWDFIINYLKLDKDKLWITIYQEDDESGEIWEKTGVPKERILKKGKKDNFWGPPGPSGPCGPCSEIHYDLGEHLKCSDDCGINTCECDRWMEIWNLVFMEMFQDEEGNFSALEKKNVDTGMGLERIAMVCQGVNSTFETDLLMPILNKISEIADKKYGDDPKTDVSLRIIADHARCVTFMESDGISASNEGRGYVLRMILRRALRHGFILGLELPFMRPIVEVVLENYREAYPDLEKNRQKIIKNIETEENRFKQTLTKGYGHIEELVAKLKADKKTVIEGEDAFKLYDTYGFPLELTEEIARESGLKVDKTGFERSMKEQKERARASATKVVLTNELSYVNNPDTKFVGYTKDTCDSKVLSIVVEQNTVESSSEGDIADVILDCTPFYAESGGQVGDIGYLELENGEKLEVLKTFKVGKVFVHRIQGAVKVGDKVRARIDASRRREVEKHHSIAHLLQAALINVLGDEVKQSGSQVEDKRARYDFSFPRALTQEELAKVEKLMNSWIQQGLMGQTEVMDIEKAKKQGAIALFGEKYDQDVRVVSFTCGDNVISQELCGGSHVGNTGTIGLCKIVSEGAISAGVRRVEVLCSNSALEHLSEKAQEIDKIAQKYKIKYTQIEDKIEKLLEENRIFSAKIGQLEAEKAQSSFATFLSKAKDAGGGKVFVSRIEDFAPNAIKSGVELLSSKLGESVIVLCSVKPDGSVFIMANATDSFVKKGVSAGNIVKQIASACGGNGGGKPQFAQGAGKDASKLDAVLVEVEKEILNLDG